MFQKLVITVFAILAQVCAASLFPSCGASLPSVEDARAAVTRAREAQATACKLVAGPETAEKCHQASYALQVAETALRGAQELESALAADAGVK